ncbi:MAG: hypothetical protein IKO19_01985 [Candidatus Riflebacteria bacterium]|nr:hypothetical protein [Candidatus Riflebacteria bacterium]
MRKLISLKFLVVISMASFLLTAPQVRAQDDDFGIGDVEESSESNASPASSGEKTESDIIEDLCQRMRSNDEKLGKASLEFKSGKWTPILEKPEKDPFKPIIEKEVVLPPVRQQPVAVKPQEKKAPAPPPIKPIKLFVSGIVGNEGNRLAIVKFENEELTISKDQIVEGKFKVVDIYADRVVVYSNKEQRRHTYKIGGDEK